MTNQDVLRLAQGNLSQGWDFSISSRDLSDSGALWVADEARCHCIYFYESRDYWFSLKPFFCGHVLDKILR